MPGPTDEEVFLMFDGRIYYQHTKTQPSCEVEDTLKGGHCEKRAEVRLDGLLLCERHAAQLRLEELADSWAAILLHVELWSGAARSRGREDVVRLLEVERERAASALGRVLEDLERSGGDRGRRAILTYGIR
jgi:hypothetical protein